jgi:hypothetical protein
MDESDTNEEIRDLYTHQAGATDLHKTRKLDEPMPINPPEVPTTGRYDDRPANQKHGD